MKRYFFVNIFIYVWPQAVYFRRVQQVVNITELDRAKTLLHPIRLRLLHLLVDPASCRDLAEQLGTSQQRVNNHLKQLLKAGLVRIAKRRRVRNLIEATYVATGRAFWVSPELTRNPRATDEQFRDRLSLSKLLLLTEEVQALAASLLEATDTENVPSLSLSVDVSLSSAEQREAFTRDVLGALAPVLKRYEGNESSEHRFKTVLMCLPETKEQTP